MKQPEALGSFARWITLGLLIAAVAVHVVASLVLWDAEAGLSPGWTSYPVLTTVVQPAPHDPELLVRAHNAFVVQRIALVAGLLAFVAHLVVLNVAIGTRPSDSEGGESRNA